MAALPPIRIDSIAHGGDGIGTLPDGKKVFVPLTAPGDLVEAEALEDRGQHVRARLVRVLEPSAERVETACPHAAACGGCQLQQLSPASQLAAKERVFYEALARLGGTPREKIPAPSPILASPKPFRYRIRCRLHVRDGALGYLRRGSHELEGIEECHLLVPELEKIALGVAEALRARPLRFLRDVDVAVGADGQGAIALHPDAKAPVGWADKADRVFDGVAGVKGVVALPPPAALPRTATLDRSASLRKAAQARVQKRPQAPGMPSALVPPKVFGDPVISRPAPLADGVRLYGRPDAFAQANAEGNALLVEAAVEGLEIKRDDEILELYCGAGNFTFALAGRASMITAVEEAGVSLDLARKAAAEAKVQNVRFIAADAAQVAAGFAQERRDFDLVLLDPPRAGAKGLAGAIAALHPRRIAYVSCDPATLARDVAAFAEHGYEVLAATPVDMFPQTFHVEGVVILWKPGS